MKRILSFALATITLIVLCSCGMSKQDAGTDKTEVTVDGVVSGETGSHTDEGNDTDISEAGTATDAVQPGDDVDPEVLSFLEDGYVYFDVNTGESVKDFKVTVDGEDAANKAVKYTADSVVNVEGNASDNGKVSLFVVFVDADGSASFTFSRSVKAIDAAETVESKFRIRKNKTKLYIAVLEKENMWNKDLSEGLNGIFEPFAELAD